MSLCLGSLIKLTVGTTAVLFGMCFTSCQQLYVFLYFKLQLILHYFNNLIMGNYHTQNLGNTVIH